MKVKLTETTHPLYPALAGDLGVVVSQSETDGVRIFSAVFEKYGGEVNNLAEDDVEVVEQ